MQPDVAIIGGGPAGCAAALALLNRGHSVVVIASASQRAKPTETAEPALARLLRSLGATEALSVCEPCHGIASAWGRATPVLQPGIINPYGHAWFIHRAPFDACLQQTARDRGAQWLIEEAQSFVEDPEGVSISTTGKPVSARWAVIATGSPASAARLTCQKAAQIDSMIAFWAHLPTNNEERLLRVEPADCGWWYLCPADGPATIACFVTDPATSRNLRPDVPARWNDLFGATALHRQIAGDPSAAAVHVALTGLAALPQTHGSRWIAVGDAAAKLDPLGSSGTATALDSGQRAAHAIAEALRGNTASLDKYSRWSAGLVTEFASQRRQEYESEARRQDNDFWSRRILVAA